MDTARRRTDPPREPRAPMPPPDVSAPLFAAAYVSTPTVAFSDRDLADLLLAARHYNVRHAITGKLIAAEAEDEDGATRLVRFVQWIEGDAADVRLCLRRIHADPRHGELEIQFFGPVAARRFPSWDMAIETVPAAALAEATRSVVPDAVPDAVPVTFESLDLA